MIFPWEKFHVFAGLNPEALEFLRARAKELRFAGGEAVVREGETGNKMFLLADGRVQVVKNLGAENALKLAELGPGEFFGEMCILETLPRAASVLALNDTVLFALASLGIYQFYQAMPAQYSILALNIARDVSRRLRKIDEAFAAKH